MGLLQRAKKLVSVGQDKDSGGAAAAAAAAASKDQPPTSTVSPKYKSVTIEFNGKRVEVAIRATTARVKKTILKKHGQSEVVIETVPITHLVVRELSQTGKKVIVDEETAAAAVQIAFGQMYNIDTDSDDSDDDNDHTVTTHHGAGAFPEAGKKGAKKRALKRENRQLKAQFRQARQQFDDNAVVLAQKAQETGDNQTKLTLATVRLNLAQRDKELEALRHNYANAVLSSNMAVIFILKILFNTSTPIILTLSAAALGYHYHYRNQR